MLSQYSLLPTRAILVTAALILTAALPTSADQPGEKKAVPDATALGKAEATVTRLFAAQLKEAKTDKGARPQVGRRVAGPG